MRGSRSGKGGERGKWLALAAALLGWMFDGLEQGLFPLVAHPALQDLLGTTDEGRIGLWLSVGLASFLVGAATGGVLFGWLGDRIGRVRAMTLSVLTYAVFSGLCGLTTAAWQVAVLRFFSALGMGGEWSLGVALIMEIWPEKSRGLLAGLIGAAANVGFLLIGLIGLGLRDWRLLFFVGATPAVLTFFIQLFVPESERWQREHSTGSTAHWATRDLLGVAVGALGACLVIYAWAAELPWPLRLPATFLGLLVAVVGYLYPVVRYLQRSGGRIKEPYHGVGPTVRRMLLGACLGGVALLGTWGANQWIPTWADQLTHGDVPHVRSYVQILAALGAIAGTVGGALLASWIGRRITYSLLCLGSLGSALLLYWSAIAALLAETRGLHAVGEAMAAYPINSTYGPWFLFSVFLGGCTTAAFYGWLPLYLPELFRPAVRATGQGFSYNFGRILAAMGVLQTGNLMKQVLHNNYPQALAVISLVYVLGLALIWLAPETHGKPLPE